MVMVRVVAMVTAGGEGTHTVLPGAVLPEFEDCGEKVISMVT